MTAHIARLNKVSYGKQIASQHSAPDAGPYSGFTVDSVKSFLSPSLITLQNLVALAGCTYVGAP